MDVRDEFTVVFKSMGSANLVGTFAVWRSRIDRVWSVRPIDFVEATGEEEDDNDVLRSVTSGGDCALLKL